MQKRHIFLTSLILCAACGGDAGGDRADGGASSPDARVAADTGVAATDAATDAATVLDATTPDDAAYPAPPADIGPSDRPARLIAPDAYDGRTRFPLLVMMHGYTGNATSQDAYFRMSEVTRRRGLYLVLPNGTMDADGRRFWNATDACCDFGGSGVDDVAYLTSLVDEVESSVPVDTSRIYFIGHSNGGFMSYRMACERAERITAIATLAGSDFLEADRCVPSRPVSVLQIHGTADGTINYGGGSFDSGAYPGAETVVQRWARRAGCDVAAVQTLANRDVDGFFGGAESEVLKYSTGCEESVDVELWRIPNASHTPSLSSTFADQVVDWLLAHQR